MFALGNATMAKNLFFRPHLQVLHRPSPADACSSATGDTQTNLTTRLSSTARRIREVATAMTAKRPSQTSTQAQNKVASLTKRPQETYSQAANPSNCVFCTVTAMHSLIHLTDFPRLVRQTLHRASHRCCLHSRLVHAGFRPPERVRRTWESIFSLIAAFIILPMGLTMLKLDRARAKWRVKLQPAFEKVRGMSFRKFSITKVRIKLFR